MLASKRHHPGSWRRPAGRTVVSSRYKFIQTTTVDSTGLQDAHNPWPGGLQPDTAALCSVSCKQHPALQKSCSEVGHTALEYLCRPYLVPKDTGTARSYHPTILQQHLQEKTGALEGISIPSVPSRPVKCYIGTIVMLSLVIVYLTQ